MPTTQWPLLPTFSITQPGDEPGPMLPQPRPFLRRIIRSITHPLPQPTPLPPTHITDLHIHDPSIIHDATTNTYYAYGSGPRIPIHTAPSLSGPWTLAGTVLSHDSKLPRGDTKAPWAPTTISLNGVYYCFYATSNSGCRNSALGVATSSHPGPDLNSGPSTWTDHGALPLGISGIGITTYPFDRANAIDISVVIDHTTDGTAYMSFGSFWTGIWQIPLTGDFLGADPRVEEVRHLAFEPTAVHPPAKKADGVCGDATGMHPIEGAFVSFRDPWWYLWFSWGKCCHFDPERLPREGMEYSIRLGRSLSPRGPFHDKRGRDLLNGGGETIYASNDDVYAPGGQGVLADEGGMYFIIIIVMNKSIGYGFHDARLGFNPLVYVDGWPVAQ
ncbi:endo-1,5-alpha-L-arabinosidase [Aspergillus heteromorphus CBS 117.55]|uniref:Arabinan endo-1,5-alpha-L-arabinosidase n=1 Tax=Aspergillus heteromorphus CBS 117.55 TaxID=1448321 RepID=A0A317VJ19_9EURO|nr:endo-1,5-alpha-L-arabinosidase [Aspergillus heteromorphus CBS 117.55]PWY74364.1 endo-1,5-alpha-L-arabinosidase [Aspergillus heteromorphus CBS 117.55]